MLRSHEAEANPTSSHVQTAAIDEKPSGSVQILQLDNAPPPQYMGSERDKEDMLMLGRQQVLLVYDPQVSSSRLPRHAEIFCTA